MAPLEAAYTLAAVSLIVVAVLLSYLWIVSDKLATARSAKESWRDAFVDEARRHAQTRDELDRRRMARLP